jgi:hypothetical protein
MRNGLTPKTTPQHVRGARPSRRSAQPTENRQIVLQSLTGLDIRHALRPPGAMKQHPEVRNWQMAQSAHPADDRTEERTGGMSHGAGFMELTIKKSGNDRRPGWSDHLSNDVVRAAGLPTTGRSTRPLLRGRSSAVSKRKSAQAS